MVMEIGNCRWHNSAPEWVKFKALRIKLINFRSILLHQGFKIKINSIQKATNRKKSCPFSNLQQIQTWKWWIIPYRFCCLKEQFQNRFRDFESSEDCIRIFENPFAKLYQQSFSLKLSSSHQITISKTILRKLVSNNFTPRCQRSLSKSQTTCTWNDVNI